MNTKWFDGSKSSDTTRYYRQSFAGFYVAVVVVIALGVWAFSVILGS